MEIDIFLKWKSYFHLIFDRYRFLAACIYALNITSISEAWGWLDRGDLSQSIAKESISHLTIEEAEDAERCFVVQLLFVIGIDMGWDEIRLFLRIQAESV